MTTEGKRPSKRWSAPLRVAVIVVAAAGLAGLSYAAAVRDRFPWDLPVARWFQSFDPVVWDKLLHGMSWVGEGTRFVPLLVVVAGLIFALRWRWEAALLLACGAAGAIGLALKHIVERPRPPADLLLFGGGETGWSFPSIHAALTFASIGYLGHVLARRLPLPWLRPMLAVLVGGAIALMGVSRIYLGSHWPSDVLGGYLVGLVMLMAVMAVADAVKARASR